MYVWMDGRMYVWMNVWMDELTYGWMDGWMDRWMLETIVKC
jgi:hypothetical protein